MRRVAGSVAGFHGKKTERAGPFVLVRERVYVAAVLKLGYSCRGDLLKPEQTTLTLPTKCTSVSF